MPWGRVFEMLLLSAEEDISSFTREVVDSC